MPKHILWLSLLLLALSLQTTSCLPEPCDGTISTLTLDPSGTPCTKRCECNNQNYEGYCIQSKCTALKRETCQTAGREESCTIQSSFASQVNCKTGLKICKAEGLDALKWGDCVCSGTQEKTAEKAQEAAKEPTSEKADEPVKVNEPSKEPSGVDASEPLPEKGTPETPKEHSRCNEHGDCSDTKPFCMGGTCSSQLSMTKDFDNDLESGEYLYFRFLDMPSFDQKTRLKFKSELKGDFSPSRVVYFTIKNASVIFDLFGTGVKSCNSVDIANTRVYPLATTWIQRNEVVLRMTVPKDKGGCGSLEATVTISVDPDAGKPYSLCDNDDLKCSGDQICLDSRKSGGTLERCFDKCTDNSDCPKEWLCRGARGVTSAGSLGCFKKCASDADCAALSSDVKIVCDADKKVCVDVNYR